MALSADLRERYPRLLNATSIAELSSHYALTGAQAPHTPQRLLRERELAAQPLPFLNMSSSLANVSTRGF